VPEYRLVSAEGPEHAKTFTCQVYLGERLLGSGQGPSRKGAEQAAAEGALNRGVFDSVTENKEMVP